MKAKLVIPSILAATVLVAGIFAFMPIERASTVHTTIISQVAPDERAVEFLILDGMQIDHDGGNDVDPDEVIILYDGIGKGKTATIEVNTNLKTLGVLTDTATNDKLILEKADSTGHWSAVGTLNTASSGDHIDVDSTHGLRLRLVDGNTAGTITFPEGSYISLTIVGK